MKQGQRTYTIQMIAGKKSCHKDKNGKIVKTDVVAGRSVGWLKASPADDVQKAKFSIQRVVGRCQYMI